MKKPYFLTVTVLVLQAVVLLFSFSSCSSHFKSSSFTSELELIDNCIASGNTKDALSYLKKVSKKAYSSFARIGIYKRYMTLGEKELAEKTLVAGLKKIPDNPELTAVYAQFLLRDDRINEALELSRKLSGTDYGSLYAEAVFRAAYERKSDAASVFVPKKKYKAPKKNKKVAEEGETPFSLDAFFMKPEFITVYTDAWRGTKQALWLRNAAVLHLGKGSYDEAVLLAPQTMEDAVDALFWGTVYYDAGRYGESLASLLQAQNVSFYSQQKENTVPEEIAALEADDYYILGDEDSSQKEREILLDGASSIIEKYEEQVRNPLISPTLNKQLATIIPVVYMNNARYAYLHNDIVTEYKTLVRLVHTFPLYVPGLAAYGQFAFDVLRRPPEDAVLQELRAAGIKTLRMEENDALPKIDVADVVRRIDEILKTKKVPGLIVLREELLDVSNKTAANVERISRIWQLLEKNEKDTNSYPPEIMKYSVSRLIALGAKDKAKTLFTNYLQSEYGNSFKSPAEKPELLSLWECEFAAWFAADESRASDSRRLYEYILEKYATRMPSMNASAENGSVVNAYVNLAVIYSASGKDDKALELLNGANARTVEPVLKSEILYRMALVSKTLGDEVSARRSLQYAVTLNPSLNKAYLMLKQLE